MNRLATTPFFVRPTAASRVLVTILVLGLAAGVASGQISVTKTGEHDANDVAALEILTGTSHLNTDAIFLLVMGETDPIPVRGCLVLGVRCGTV